jgi:hypothetical protein
MYKYNDKVHLLDYGTDTLFIASVSGDLQPHAICSLGSMKCVANVAGLNKQQVEALSSKLRIDNINEDNRLLYINLVWGMDGNSCYALFDKTTGEVSGLGEEGLINDIDGGISFFPQQIEDDGTMLMWLQAEDFKEKILSSDYEQQKAKYGDKFEKVHKLASSLLDDDNPVLILVK